MLGSDADIFLLGMFAVGGGATFVLPPFGVPPLLCFGDPAAFPCGFGVAPYFFSSSCVELYFVAVLSFSMVLFRCFSSSFSCDWTFDVR